jgi:hypothetical protein
VADAGGVANISERFTFSLQFPSARFRKFGYTLAMLKTLRSRLLVSYVAVILMALMVVGAAMHAFVA